MGPIKTNEVNFKKCALLHNRVLIGIDFGCTLTKFIFLNKNKKNQLDDESCDHVTFQEALFKTEDFESAMEWLKANAFVPENTTFTIHGTGIGFFGHKERIELIFGIKVAFIKEDLAISAGHRIALEQIGEEHLKAPSIVLDNVYTVNNGILKMVRDAMKKRLPMKNEPTTEDSTCFPNLLFICDDYTSGFYYFNENGLAEQVGPIQDYGKTFFGMAKCILDTNNYDEIVELAKDGNRNNIDTQVKDVFGELTDNYYGKFPPEMPVFTFGKIGEQINQLKEFSKNDLASSLIALNAAFIYSECYRLCERKKLTRIYLYGHMFQANLFQKEIEHRHKVLPIGLELIFLDLEYSKALGVIFCSNDKKADYMK